MNARTKAKLRVNARTKAKLRVNARTKAKLRVNARTKAKLRVNARKPIMYISVLYKLYKFILLYKLWKLTSPPITHSEQITHKVTSNKQVT